MIERLIDGFSFLILIGVIALVLGILIGFSLAEDHTASDCKAFGKFRITHAVYACSEQK